MHDELADADEPGAITLPDAQTLMAAIRRPNDPAHLVKGFYTPLCESLGGRHITPDGVVTEIAIVKAIYAESIPTMKIVIDSLTPRYINAIITDETARQAALEAWEEAKEIMNRQHG